MNFGDWEMKKWDDLDQDMLNVWMKDFVNVRIPGGESFMDLYERVIDFIDELSRKNYKKIAVITHGGVIRCFLAYAGKIKLKDAFTIYVEYGSVTRIVM